MSINEVIKKYLPLKKQKLSYANKKYNYCFNYSYQNYRVCKENKKSKCAKKLVYQFTKQINSKRWHIFFLCLNNHLVIRWVSINNKFILVGQIKN